MPLPMGGDQPWPPEECRTDYARYSEHSAWYSGSTQQLTNHYLGYPDGGMEKQPGGFFDPATTAQPQVTWWRRFFFWAKQNPGAVTRNRIHVPIAADIAATSADLLFSDPPDLLIPEAHVNRAAKAAKAAQDRLDVLIDEDGIHTTLLEAGEVASALGGVFLRASWDKDFAPRPLLTAVHPDSAVPEFRWGYLAAVTFWRVVAQQGKDVWRLLERHEKGVILNGLYKGTSSKLGIQQRLVELPETAGLTDAFKTGIDRLTVVYIPNMRPNRSDRSSFLGRSDYSGSEGLMDSLDETFTSWMRDIRLGRARLIVPEEYLRSLGKGKGADFDVDREIYEAIGQSPQMPMGDTISAQQFQIRTQEHMDTAMALVERIVAAAGYSGSTFGLHGSQMATVERTATEVKAREHRSLVTRGKKSEYWRPAISDILEVVLAIDEKVFNGPGTFRPRVDFPENIQDAKLDIATAVELLTRANAISQKTKIEMVHPDWDPDEVEAELKLIEQTQPALATAPSAKGSAPSGSSEIPGSAPPSGAIDSYPA